MSDIRPADLPEIRAALSGARDDRLERDLWEGRVRQMGESWISEGLSRADVERALAQVLERADMFFVSEEMGALAQAASETVPEFEITEEDLPTRHGLLMFGGAPSAFIDTSALPDCPCGRPHHYVYAGIAWAPAPGGRFMLFPIMDRQATAILGGDPSPRGLPFGVWGADVVPHRHQCGRSHGCTNLTDGMFRTLRTTSMLMQQPLATSSEVTVDRAAQKRLRRAGQDPKPVRVIELRRPAGEGGVGGGSRDYHHSWIVRGHWRQHWYPKRQVHRPVWIAPHVKGPEGAPLLGGDKVYAWKR